jgi:hypothetical protein
MLDAVQRGLVPFSEFVSDGSADQVFRPRPLRIFSGTTSMPVAVAAIYGATATEGDWYWWPLRRVNEELLGEIGRFLAQASLPWIVDPEPGYPSWIVIQAGNVAEIVEPDARWAALAIVAAAVEQRTADPRFAIEPQRGIRAIVEALDESRGGGMPTRQVDEWLQGFTHSQRALLIGWTEGKVSLTNVPARRDESVEG